MQEWCEVIVIKESKSPSETGTEEQGRSAGTARLAMCNIHTHLVGLRWQGQDGRSSSCPFSKKRFNSNNIVRYHDTGLTLAGRWGAVSVKNPGSMDLFVAGCYAYIEGDDRGAKLWDHVSTVLASVRARTTIVMAVRLQRPRGIWKGTKRTRRRATTSMVRD